MDSKSRQSQSDKTENMFQSELWVSLLSVKKSSQVSAEQRSSKQLWFQTIVAFDLNPVASVFKKNDLKQKKK